MADHDGAQCPSEQRMRVAIIAEIRLYREGLALELDRRGFDVVGTAADARALEDWIPAQRPDVALVDIATTTSEASLVDLVGSAAGTRVVALGVPETAPDVVACAEAGVVGYVPREASLDDVVETLHRVARGEILCTPTIAGSLFHRVGALARERGPDPALDRLTAREREIVNLIDEGLSNKQIALRLRIELSTVKNHVHNVFEKLKVQRRADAAACARRPRERRPVGEQDLQPPPVPS